MRRDDTISMSIEALPPSSRPACGRATHLGRGRRKLRITSRRQLRDKVSDQPG